MKKSLILILAGIVLFMSMTVALANSNPPPRYAQASLLSDYSTLTPGQTFYVVLHLKLRPHWHSYWKNPGDSGLSPNIEWSLPQGFIAGAIDYLPPQRLVVGGLITYGYEDNAYYLIPMRVASDVTAGNYTIWAKADYLVCETICVPEDADLSISVNVADQAQESVDFALIGGLTYQLPRYFPGKAQYSVQGDRLLLTLNTDVLATVSIKQLEFYPLNESVVELNQLPQVNLRGGQYELLFKRDFLAPPELFSGLLIVHYADKDKPAYFYVEAKNPDAASLPIVSSLTATDATDSIWYVLLLALLGGMILNLMPCVFPILSLKALTLAQTSQQQYRQNLAHGVLYLLGVVVCFAIIASVLLTLQLAGHSVGWGYQLQSPLTITLLLYLFFFIGLNLSGVFEFGLSVMGLGNRLPHAHGYLDSFSTGILAAVIATPCTAPFMGTAIGYAFTQPPAIAFAVIITLGIGMALPLFLLSVLPGLSRFLPKPGAWMVTFKEILAFFMYLSCAWLLWVLIQQVSDTSVLSVLFGLIALVFLIWIRKKLANKSKALRYLLTLVVILLAIYPVYQLQDDQRQQTTIQALHQAFSQQSLQTLLSEHKPVFVNVTAAWCISCKVNERLVLKTAAVQHALKDYGITYLEADWTNRNQAILDYLSSFDRSGVPLYVVYNRQGQATLLPQLLTTDIVIDAFKQAENT